MPSYPILPYGLVGQFWVQLTCLFESFSLFIWWHAQAYDQHLNMVLSEVEETVTTVEVDEETFEEMYKVQQPI